MRTARLILSIIGFGAPALGLRSAGPSIPDPEDASSVVRPESAGDRPSDNAHGARQGSRKGPLGENPPGEGKGNGAKLDGGRFSAEKRADMGRAPGHSGNASIPDRSSAIHSAGAPAGGFMRQNVEHPGARAFTAPNPASQGAPPHNPTHSPGPAQAVLAGASFSRARDKLELSGSEMPLRP
jgi:hypothetical protein